MAKAYDAYFRSGLYHSRYPRPNRRTLRFLTRYLPVGGRLLDYGAGEGRYCLAVAETRQVRSLAVDVSPVARQLLAERTAELGLSERIEICDTDDAVYRARVPDSRSFDVALLGFGVLGHIAGRARRIELLRELGSSLAPEGRLVMGLPNAARRFRAAQAEAAPRIASGELEPGDICYARHAGEESIALFYHLFTADEIAADLAAAGLVLEHLTAESMLPERAVTHSGLIARLDDGASTLLPPRWSYGYLAIARTGGR